MTTAPTPFRSNPFLRALARWESEGGSSHAIPADFDHNAVLLHLGTAVMMRWSNLPRKIQRDLFDAAAEMDEPNADAQFVRQHIALFLHQHKSDELSADFGGEA